jgi:hypothetical protein
MTTSGFGYGSRPVYLDRAVYTTITIMSVLIAYDGWQSLKFWAAAGGNPRTSARHFPLTRLLSIPRPASRAARASRPPRADENHPDRVAFPSPGRSCPRSLDHLDCGRGFTGQLNPGHHLPGRRFPRILGLGGRPPGRACWMAAGPDGGVRPDFGPSSPRASGIPPARQCFPGGMTACLRVSGTSFGSPYWKVHPAVMAIRPTNRMSQRLPLWAAGGPGEPAAALLIW